MQEKDTEKKKPCCSASRNVAHGLGKVDVATGGPAKLNGMSFIPAGAFLMGTDDAEGFRADGEGPVREVSVNAFYIDATTVTNLQFAEFVKATRYITDAERYGWSFVFEGLLSADALNAGLEVPEATPWWCMVYGANWKNPEGIGSSIANRMDHPVVHVSWFDAMNYSQWAGKRLPTEAEWEKAARGGLVQNTYPWGNELTPGGHHKCNIWQGSFPEHNSLEDGYLGTAPAKSFDPNAYGLYNVSGNVWEWCSDWFSADHHNTTSSGNLQGQTRVMKGGSFLCHHSYCNRYRVAARSSNTPDSSASNVGFRCVANEPNE